MNFNEFPENPFQIKISFHKVLETLEHIAASDVDYRSNYAKALLERTSKVPELRNGITNMRQIDENSQLIKHLMADLFPTALTKNEIKAVTIPFLNITFNYTERFKKILKEAGNNFDFTIRNLNQHQFYVMSCCLILNAYYKQHLDFNPPLFYDIPDANGILKHYRILYNADFLEIIPTEKAVALTPEDIALLMDNFDDLDLWKEKFPHQSWLLKGFGIIILYDATTENAVSNLKSNLLRLNSDEKDIKNSFEKIFRSIFKISDLKIGFTSFVLEEIKFNTISFDKKLHSFLLCQNKEMKCNELLNTKVYQTLVEQKKALAISNVTQFSKEPENAYFGNLLLSQDIHSCILAPVVKDGQLLGIVELVSSRVGELNSLNSQKLDIVMPFIVDTIDRYNSDIHTKIEAIIQKEYTSIHPSVYWKFQNEVKKYLFNEPLNPDYVFGEIVFKDVYPLYGQIDIKESSDTRNHATKTDIQNQLYLLISVLQALFQETKLNILEQRIFELKTYSNETAVTLKADSEQQIQRYIENEIHPMLKKQSVSLKTQKLITNYFNEIDPITGSFYKERKKFDSSLSTINQKLSAILDHQQKEAQAIFPHYFERFNTDGVEHNMYIGSDICPQGNFNLTYLYNMRLWQLQVLSEMNKEHYAIRSSLSYPLEVTSLILVFSSPITIRFRMDEKRFDIDGSYNARYEVIKKRIDKALEKGTQKRITAEGKITIVYSHREEEKEYIKYIEYLQFQKILEPTIEFLEVEDLQGISGLKAIRVGVSLP
ncbi:GAF domain-containing protein [Flavobacterium luminosum]|uniref:GAF domain-containing protein n=1 Tax=Flavobacterium luminosum TaxID=2949086 RepID=A0ABT0TNA2_9FLAO|nr:GAF domain-containing protein [Flavobacterium sp. HXWNR70]MCL9808952.1 GAF domain-containing protein [Flavobacterium sp. HXWNR70]